MQDNFYELYGMKLFRGPPTAIIPATQTSMYEYNPKFDVVLYGLLANKKWIQREIYCNRCNQRIGNIATKSDLEDHYICFRCERKEDEVNNSAECFNREKVQVRKHLNS